MSEFSSIPNDSRITVVLYEPAFSVICSIGKAPFFGTITIEYRPADKLLEFESFEKWLRTIAMQSFTIESLTRALFDGLTRVLGDIPLRVTVHARTTVHAPVSATIERT